MSKSFADKISKAAAVAAIAVAVSLSATASGSAATRHRTTLQDAPAYSGYYNFVPNQGDLTPGQVGRRTNPTIVPPGAFGPPDPASCGGFHC